MPTTELPLLSVKALHIPDGFLSLLVSVAGWVLTTMMIAVALRRTRDQLGERQIPLLGVMAAFVFAAQAVNFPVAGGTSGHLLGGALAGIILGPWSGVLVMTAVIGLQAFLFQDGGLLAMGWNVMNMGVLTVLTGVFVYQLLHSWLAATKNSMVIAGAVGSWLSIQVAAGATAVELAVSGTSPIWIALPAMLGIHAVIGLGEAVITVGALLLIEVVRPDLLSAGEKASREHAYRWTAGGLIIALLIAVLSSTGSAAPDGLERVAADGGFLGKALSPIVRILPDYTVPGIENEVVAGVAAVLLGTVVAFSIAIALARLSRYLAPRLGARRAGQEGG